MRKENRLMIVHVDQRLLLELFNPLGQVVAIKLEHPKLPADAEVVDIHHDYACRAFAAIVHSAEFPEAPRGAQLPLFEGGSLFEYKVRYVDGDRLTDYMPPRMAASEARREGELRAAAIRTGLVDLYQRQQAGERVTYGQVAEAIGYLEPLPPAEQQIVVGPALKAAIESRDEVVFDQEEFFRRSILNG